MIEREKIKKSLEELEQRYWNRKIDAVEDPEELREQEETARKEAYRQMLRDYFS